MPNDTAKTIATLAAGDTVRYGSSFIDGETVPCFTTVVAADADKVTIENPDAGRVFGNTNRAPVTLTFKRSSKTFAARAHLPIA